MIFYLGTERTAMNSLVPFLPVPQGRLGLRHALSPFAPPGTLGTGRIQSFRPPSTLRTGGAQSFRPPRYPENWRDSVLLALRYPVDWQD